MKLVNGIPNDLQKLLKYFRGTANFTFVHILFLLTAFDSPKKLDLYLKDVKLSVATLSGFLVFVTEDLSLLNCHKRPDVSE